MNMLSRMLTMLEDLEQVRLEGHSDESLLDSSQLSGRQQSEDQSRNRCRADTDVAGDLTTPEAICARALQLQANIALRFTKLVGDAEKAATLAERSRIAHELHDSLTHCLTGIYIQLEAAAQLRLVSPEQADSCIAKAAELAHDGLREIRCLVGTLRTDATQYCNLAQNLRRLASESTCEAGAQVRLDLLTDIGLISVQVGYELFQIAREAVGNALRYARAKRIILRLAFDGGVDLSIEDDGIGFQVDKSAAPIGCGLNAMRQRANRLRAKFTLRSSRGAGTLIGVSVRSPSLN